MYKRIILISCLLGLFSPVFGATMEDYNSITQQCTITCHKHLRRCTFVIDNTDIHNAYTTLTNIHTTNGIINLLSVNELRSVLYHELAHRLLHHVERGKGFYNYIELTYHREPTRDELSNFKHQVEFEADHYACILQAKEHQPIELDSALIKLYEGRDMNREWFSHPSANERIKRIREYKKQLGY